MRPPCGSRAPRWKSRRRALIKIALGEQVIGHGRQELVGVEIGDGLGAVPAGVSAQSRHGLELTYATTHDHTSEPRIDDLLSTRARIGWGASAPPARPVADAAFEFGGGHPDPASFPYEGMVEATADVMKADGAAAFSYGEAQGYKGLRELVAHKYRLFENLEVSPDNVIVSNGSGHALSLAFSAFVDLGDAILSEAPTFSGTLATIRRHGARVLDVPLDAEGMDTKVARQQLELLRREGKPCKLIYTIVNFQNPAGPTMSRRRREELIALAHEYETVILEDDAYGELRFEGQAASSLYALDKGGRTMRAGTLSKILGAGCGWAGSAHRRR